MQATIIIPFHCQLVHLQESLPAVRRSMPGSEVLIAADGAVEDCRPLAAEYGARVIEVPGPAGPATARNRAAREATGDMLVFVDADVVVAPDTLPGMCALLERQPQVAGVFGAYDLSPRETNFMSQYKNLSHAYVHEIGNPNASTFWAGLGAVRTSAFRAVGGFDERFHRPSVEDIELGYRLVQAGYTLRLAPEFRAQHLKRWTLWSSIATDIRARGVPWTQLIHRFQMLSNDLNTRVQLRLSVILTYTVTLLSVLSIVTPWAALAAAGTLAVLVSLNYDYYRWFVRQRGVLFALAVVPAHLLHHLCNGVSFVIGTSLHLATRAGIRLPGALPAPIWPLTGSPACETSRATAP